MQEHLTPDCTLLIVTPFLISTKKLSKTKLQWHLPTASSKGKKSIWVLNKESTKWSEVNHWKVLNFCIWGHMGYSASGSDRLRQWWWKSNIRSLYYFLLLQAKKKSKSRKTYLKPSDSLELSGSTRNYPEDAWLFNKNLESLQSKVTPITQSKNYDSSDAFMYRVWRSGK